MKSAIRRMKKTQAKRKRTAKEKAKSQAIVLAKAAPAAIQVASAIPKLTETIESMEKVRRFVSKCLNTDLQVALAKLAKDVKLKPEERIKEEIALRERLEIDWGTIPGVDKPFLKQPGAEKFMFWLHLRPKYHNREIEGANGHLEIVAHVVMFSKKTNEEVFEGPDCSCTTMESNYRFRFSEREVKPPQEETDRLKQQQLGKFRKKKIYAYGKPTGKEEWVWLDRIENPNIHDERNKVRQIGEKRALVKCIRNMGAISEIFTSSPDEWEIPEEDLGSPREDMDFTPSGRQIVDEKGFAPSGKPVTYQAQTEMDKQAAAKVAERKTAEYGQSKSQDKRLEAQGKPKPEPDKPIDVPPPPGSYGTVTVSYDNDAGLPNVSGDIANILYDLRTTFLGVWLDKAKSWVIPEDQIESLKKFCLSKGIGFSEVKSSGAALTPSAGAQPAAKAPEPAKSSPGGGSASHAAPTPIAGKIVSVKDDVTSKQKIPIVRVVWGNAHLICFDKKIWDYLRAGVGKPAELILDANKGVIEGIKRIGLRGFMEGHIPEVQLNEERPATTADLFKE